MSTTVRHFSNEIELKSVWPEYRDKVRALFPDGKIKKYDGYSLLVGSPDKLLTSGFLPVTRSITYKTNGSNHKCGARCRSAKGHNCECECGGRNHGIDG